jgi:hypothetical protein
LVNETELLQKYMGKYTDLNLGLGIAIICGLVFALMLLWMYYQDKYLHALRTIALICEKREIGEDSLAVYVKQSKKLPSKKWREHFE